MRTIRILNNDEVKSLLDLKTVIKCVENAYILKSKNEARLFSMISEEIIKDKAEMDIKSGSLDSNDVFGLKLVSWFGDNAEQNLPTITGLTMLFDLTNGFAKGLINASYLTSMRTGAAGALGIKYLAKSDTDTLAVVGTGSMAIFQIAASLSLIENIKKVYIYNPRNYEKTLAFKAKIKGELGKIINDLNDRDNKLWLSRINKVDFIATDNPEKMMEDSQAVITVTPSKTPIIKETWVKAGTHFSCMGADVMGKQEIEEGIFKNALICVDDYEQATTVGESQTAFNSNLIHPNDIAEIGTVIMDKSKGRKSSKDVTIFDSTGISLQDLAVSNELLLKAEKLNIGSLVEI